MADPAPVSPPIIAPQTLPLVADAKVLAKLLGRGLRTIRTWHAAGKLPAPIRMGGCVVWRLNEIKDWIEAGSPDRKTWAATRAARK